MLEASQSVIIMMLASFVIGYFTMPIINTTNTTVNLNKIYASLLMAFLMGLVELGMHMRDYRWIGTLVVLSCVAIYFIRQQVFIRDKQFYLSMIEHHQMALEMANRIKEKTTDPKLIKLANNILKSQQEEIDFMWNEVNLK